MLLLNKTDECKFDTMPGCCIDVGEVIQYTTKEGTPRYTTEELKKEQGYIDSFVALLEKEGFVKY